MCIVVANNGATRNFQDNISSFGAMHFLPGTCTTWGSLEMLVVAIIDQGIQVGVSLHIDAASSTSIAPIWPTIRSELFTPKMNRAVSTITSLHVGFRMIVKKNLSLRCVKNWIIIANLSIPYHAGRALLHVVIGFRQNRSSRGGGACTARDGVGQCKPPLRFLVEYEIRSICIS